MNDPHEDQYPHGKISRDDEGTVTLDALDLGGYGYRTTPNKRDSRHPGASRKARFRRT